MAISATFKADFSSFSTAVSKVEVELRQFESDAGKVQAALQRMGDSLNGSKLRQDAATMAEAVTRIGGVSKLTDNELRKLGAQAQEAAEKMQRLGVGVPANIQAIADAAKKIKPAVDTATSGLNGMINTVGKIGAAVGIGFSVGAVVSFGKALMADADALVRMHDQTDISLQGLQRFQIAADDAGVSVESINNAIFRLQGNLSSGGLAALKELGIPFEDIKQLSPENQFIAISDAIRGIKEPVDQARLATEIFGRSAREIMPVLKRGFDDVKGAAVGMSEETIYALETLGDKMGAWSRSFKGFAAEGLVGFGEGMKNLFRIVFTGANRSSVDLEYFNSVLERIGTDIPPVAKATADLFKGPASGDALERLTRGLNQELSKSESASAKAEAATKKLAEAHQALLASIRGLDNPLREQMFLLKDLAGLGVPVTVQEMTAGFTAFKGVVKDVLAIEQSAINGTKKFTGAITEIGERVDATTDSFLNWKDATTFVGPTLEQAGRAVGTLKDVLDDIPATLARAFEGGGDWLGAFKSLGTQLADAIAAPIIAGLNRVQKTAIAIGVTASSAIGGAFGDKNAAVIGGTTSAIAGAALATTGLGAAAATSVAASVALGAATMGIGVAAVGAYYGIKKLFTVTKEYKEGRDAVKEFSEQFRSTADMIEQLGAAYRAQGRTSEEAAATIQRMWDAEQAGGAATLAVIDEVTAALQRHDAIVQGAAQFGFSRTQAEQAEKLAREIFDYMNKEGSYTAEALGKAYAAWQQAMADAGNEAAQAWVKAHEAAATAVSATSKALDDLVSRRDGLMASIAGEAPEEVMGVIEAQTRGQIAALDSQMAAQRQKLEAEAHDAASTLEEALSRIDPKPVHVPILWDIPALPSGSPWNMEAPELPGFARGTQGKYLDFGSGTPVTLHGKERVMTDGEGGGGDVYINFNGTVVGGQSAAKEVAAMVITEMGRQSRRPRRAA